MMDSTDRVIIFSTRLKHLMNGENPYGKIVNIQELAQGIGMTRQGINKYLNIGSDNSDIAIPSIVVLMKISDFFGVSPNYLLGYDSNIKEETKLKVKMEVIHESGLNYEVHKKLATFNALPNTKEKKIVKQILNTSIDAILMEVLK